MATKNAVIALGVAFSLLGVALCIRAAPSYSQSRPPVSRSRIAEPPSQELVVKRYEDQIFEVVCYYWGAADPEASTPLGVQPLSCVHVPGSAAAASESEVY